MRDLCARQSWAMVLSFGMVDFKDQLRRQLGFLTNSCEFYDRGSVEEAVRIAVALRVMFHDTGHSVSLLTHLNVKSVDLLSTAFPFVEDPMLPNLYLVELRARIHLAEDKVVDDLHCHCLPTLDSGRRKGFVAMSDWWGREPVIEHKQPATKMTRKALVLAAANKDGGAHVDTTLDPVYNYISQGSGLEIELQFKPESGRPPATLSFQHIHFASLRQIGYEVLNSPALVALSR